MNSLVPIKLTLSEFSPKDQEIDDFSLSISFNHVTSYFKPPYLSLQMQLVNFPVVSSLQFKFLKNSKAVYEANAFIQDLLESKTIELNVILMPPEDNDAPEKSRPLERKPSLRSLGSFRLSIEKEDTELKDCQLCSVFENFSTVSERALEIIIESHKSEDQRYNKIEALSLEIHELYKNKEITQERIKNIRCLLIGVNQKLKLLELYKERYEQVMVQIEEEQKSRENMQVSFKSASHDFLLTKTKLESQIISLEKRVKLLAERNLKLENTEKLFSDYKKSKELEVDTLNAKIAELDKSSVPHSITQDMVAALKKNSEFTENIGKMQKNEFSKITEGFEAVISQYQTSLSDLHHENLSLTQAFEKQSKQNTELLNQSNHLVSENLAFKSRLTECERKILYVSELEENLKNFETENEKLKEDYSLLQQQMEKISKRYNEGTRGLFADKRSLMESNKKLTEENAVLKEKVNKLETSISVKSQYPGSLDSEVGAYTSLNIQNIKLLKDIKDLCQVSNKIETEMFKEFSLVIKTVVEVSGKFLMLQRLQTRILLILKDKDVENSILRDLIAKVQKGRPVYIPVRGDYVDNQLANFLNSSVDICEVPFVRLEPGVYLFGSKRVVLRVENMEIVIRVGGGFLKLEDFIKNNTSFEVVKLMEKEIKETQEIIRKTEGNSSPDIQDLGRFYDRGNSVGPDTQKSLETSKFSLSKGGNPFITLNKSNNSSVDVPRISSPGLNKKIMQHRIAPESLDQKKGSLISFKSSYSNPSKTMKKATSSTVVSAKKPVKKQKHGLIRKE